MNPDFYTVAEVWQSDPVGDETDGCWTYQVVRAGEFVSEHLYYSTAAKAADKLNARAQVAA